MAKLLKKSSSICRKKEDLTEIELYQRDIGLKKLADIEKKIKIN